MMHLLKRFSTLAFVAVMALTVCAAGESITGVVKDATGGVIPGVNVVLTNVDTGVTRTELSNDTGNYTFSNIRPGRYELKAELEGFTPFKMTDIRVNIGDKLAYPVSLQVSGTQDQVTVKADVEQVETTTSGLDEVIDEKRITDLPLNGRNPTSLVYLTPGVTVSSAGPAANGARGRGTNYQMDGVDNNDTAVYGNIVDVNVDATQEFRVMTSNPSAEYGRAGGAIIDVITRGGTNEFHGNVFYFLRHDKLDAKTWSENYWGDPKAPYKRTQTGGSIGGPIIKDKLFFFFNTEIYRETSAGTARAQVPTADYRSLVTSAAMRQVFNTYYPMPNQPGDPLEDYAPGVAGYYVWSTPGADNREQYTTKVDYNINSSHSVSFRFFYNNYKNPAQNTLPTIQDAFAFNGNTKSVAADWTWIISPTLVNNFKFGLNRSNLRWTRDAPPDGVDLAFGGFFDVTYFSGFGGPQNYGDQGRKTGTTEFKDTFTWTKGTHTFKFGMDLRFIKDDGDTNFGIYPQAFFDPDPGYGYGDQGLGDTLANIAVGRTTFNYQQIYSDGREYVAGMGDLRSWIHREYDFFFQDDWKLRPNLTVNLGLRWEYKSAPREKNDLISNFDTTQMVGVGYHLPNQNYYYDPANWNGGVVGRNPIWVGTGADSHGAWDGYPLYQVSKKNFAPRVGISWDPWGDGKTAIRAGYGVSYDRVFDNLLSWTSSSFPFGMAGYNSLLTAPTMSGLYPNGVPYWGNGVPFPSIPSRVPANYSLDNLVIFDEKFHQPYMQTWNVSIQRELWQGNIVTVAYAGSSGSHLLTRNNPNQMNYPSAQLLAYMAARNQLSVNGTVARYQVQNSQFARIHFISQYAHSNYDALQASFSHRFQQGLQFNANYTLAKSFDNSSESVYNQGGSSPFASDTYDFGYDRGYSAFDVRHSFNASFMYELPFGPGKWIAGKSEGVLAQIIGGWQINGIIQANSGYPLDYKAYADTIGTRYVNSIRGPSRPDVASYTFTKVNNRVGPTQANFYWNTNVINVNHQKGDYYRGSFRGPGYWNVDFSLFKEIKIPWFAKNDAKLQIRMEAFNLFNTINYTNPLGTGNGYWNYSDFGVSYNSVSNRQIQFGLKFIF